MFFHRKPNQGFLLYTRAEAGSNSVYEGAHIESRVGNISLTGSRTFGILFGMETSSDSPQGVSPLIPPPKSSVRPATKPFIKFIRIFLLVLIIIGIGLLTTQGLWVPKLVVMILGTTPSPITHAVSIELHFGTLYSIAEQGKTSQVATSSVRLSKQFTVYTPDAPGDARVDIKDLKTGTTCTSGNYLITGLVLSPDEKTLKVYNYSGSNQYVSTIDTTTCKEIIHTTVLPTVRCPIGTSAHPLSSESLFDGPPSEQADLEPDEYGTWDGLRGSAVEGYYLECVYQGAQPIDIKLPNDINSCVLDGNYAQSHNVTCS